MKNNKGITLVALVITIVILIILAGISINILLGEGGLIQKAQQGAENYQKAEEAERSMLDVINETIDSVETGKIGGSTPSTPQESTPAYKTPYIPTGFTYTEGTWNSGYTIKGNAGTANENDEFVWVPCVTDASQIKAGDCVTIFGKTTEGKYIQNGLSLLSTDETVIEEDSTVSAIETSVGIYGGFYIAKYEASSSDGTENATAKSVADATAWVSIIRDDALAKAKAMVNNATTGVHSTLISGAAWDTTLQWMVNTSDNHEINAGYDTNSEGRGWHVDVSSSTGKCNTGYYAVNNIYDMAGNVWEWTTENCKFNSTDYAVNRGGNCYYSGEEYPAAYRGYRENDAVSTYGGFRCVLYK